MLEEFIDCLIDCLKIVFLLILIAILLVMFIFIFICFSTSICSYTFDNSNCNSYVDGNLVYSGRCHYVDISSISEFDSTKKMIIYSDLLRLKVSNTYVSKDIVVK